MTIKTIVSGAAIALSLTLFGSAMYINHSIAKEAETTRLKLSEAEAIVPVQSSRALSGNATTPSVNKVLLTQSIFGPNQKLVAVRSDYQSMPGSALGGDVNSAAIVSRH